MQELVELYKEWSGFEPTGVERLAGAGSNRVYYRLTSGVGRTVIGCVGTSCEENDAFVYLSRHFSGKKLPVPDVLAVSNDHLRYLQSDLGTQSLYDAIRVGRDAGGHYNAEEQHLLHKTIRELPRLQFVGHQGLDYTHCYPQAQFDEEGIFFDLNYFKYCFLKVTGVEFHEVQLEADFHRLARDLLSDASETFLYRDFQARNVMIVPTSGSPAFIDFQGGRRGPYYYDLASFLWQASARYPGELRRELINEYYVVAQTYTTLPDRQYFNQRLQLFVFFRTLQVLGAYGFRGYFERKRHFIDSISPALQNLKTLLSDGACPYAYLYDVLRRVTNAAEAKTGESEDRNTLQSTEQTRARTLVVRIYSFSYRKGVPADESGNGGGYVFDCRSTHNPGRYEPYKQLTGLDEPVIRFLEDDGEILSFLESVYRLADAHVERYLERGFNALMFAFGCTGGQHRSVYSAQHLAEHLNTKFGIEVRLCHREQGICKTLAARL